MQDKPNGPGAPPEISPYLFPLILAAMGAWCFYDGWISSNPNMQDHILFNRVCSGITLPWALIDFIRTRRQVENEKQSPPPSNGS